jgi:hypothetical protein
MVKGSLLKVRMDFLFIVYGRRHRMNQVEIKQAILSNRFIRISEEDAERVAEWASYGGEAEEGLLVIGRTGTGA